MLDGTAVKQQQWEKMATSIQGVGMFPAGLDSLDYCNPMVMQCVGYREVTKTSPTMEVTQSRRTDTDHEAMGFALTDAFGEWVPTSIISSTPSGTRTGFDNVVVTAVSGALAYRVKYLPEITVFAEHPEQDDDVRGSEISWTLNAEEV
jgi:hypothetical protein